jgi:1-phosphatidylinositol-3-phosphate 5-kinase
MDDELCKECYDCKSVFTAWRRKHHCRICGTFLLLHQRSSAHWCSDIGQVFCSRCASNVIKGSRYGHDGMIRVCNLCLEKLSKVEDDDDDDRRSVVSSTASPFATHHPSDAYLSRYTNSPFSTSQVQIPGQKSDTFNLFAIAESQRGSEGTHSSVVPTGAPHDDDLIHSTVVPFRRNLSNDEAEPIRIQCSGNERDLPAHSQNDSVDFPITVPVPGNGAISSIAFPGSPSEHALEYTDDIRSRINSSYGDFDGTGTPFVRSRVQSRIPDNFGPEPGWRSRRESTA